MFRKLIDKLSGVKFKIQQKDGELPSLKGMMATQEIEKIHKECENTMHNLDEVMEESERSGHVDLTRVENKHYVLSNYPVTQSIFYNSNSDLNGLSDFLGQHPENLELLVVPTHEKDSFVAKVPENWNLEDGEKVDLYLDFNGGKFYNLINVMKTFNLGEPIIQHEYIEDEFTVGLENGIHMRPQSEFVKIFNTYEPEIDVHCREEEINGKSIMGFVLLGAGKGSEVTFKYKLPEPNCSNKIETLEHLNNIRHYVSEYVQGKLSENISFEKYFNEICNKD